MYGFCTLDTPLRVCKYVGQKFSCISHGLLVPCARHYGGLGVPLGDSEGVKTENLRCTGGLGAFGIGLAGTGSILMETRAVPGRSPLQKKKK